ncbi:glycosyltransferase, partial [Methylobacterium sp. WL18]|uniref:glycosyltransferase family 2 protein n=1 Tax=Methylobacterium sp. WL18 TaxID=2603897 RepID=UPI0011CB91FC
MTDRAALDVVIVNWNGGALLRACLASLAAVQEAAAVQVIVVDNASQDGSADDLPALP